MFHQSHPSKSDTLPHISTLIQQKPQFLSQFFTTSAKKWPGPRSHLPGSLKGIRPFQNHSQRISIHPAGVSSCTSLGLLITYEKKRKMKAASWTVWSVKCNYNLHVKFLQRKSEDLPNSITLCFYWWKYRSMVKSPRAHLLPRTVITSSDTVINIFLY